MPSAQQPASSGRARLDVARGALATRDQPGPVADKLALVKGQAEGTPELVVGEPAVATVVQAGVEPPAVLGVLEVSLARADVGALGDGADLGGAVAGGGLGRPDAHLPPLVKDQAGRTPVLEDGVVVFKLVELDTPGEKGAKRDLDHVHIFTCFILPVELRTVFWVPVVTLPGALECSLRVLPQSSYPAFAVDNPDDSVGRDADARGDDRDHVLRSGQKVLLQGVDNQLAGTSVQPDDTKIFTYLSHPFQHFHYISPSTNFGRVQNFNARWRPRCIKKLNGVLIS